MRLTESVSSDQVHSKYFATSNVFAAGDCADAPGWRSFVSADTEANTVATNIRAAFNSVPLRKHKAGPRAMIIPLGEEGGVSSFVEQREAS